MTKKRGRPAGRTEPEKGEPIGMGYNVITDRQARKGSDRLLDALLRFYRERETA